MAGKTPSRDAYVRGALRKLPRLLQLLDRDRASRTYGCFDRQYWHYRTMDFPCGMSQEFVLPLALAFAHPFPGSRWQGEERLLEWAIAGIDFARRSAHRDGSCDDYYPFERALGATVFALYAMSEAARILATKDGSLIEFLVRRADWVARTGESGVLTNHHAIAAAALESVYQLAGEARHREAALHKAQEVLSHQHEEGWYQEYEGFDPGYQTVTVDFLARYQRESGDESVLPSLERAIALLERVQMPDGLFGGEYAARNTWHTQPHGFELLARKFPAAGRIADRYLVALEAGIEAEQDDDRLIGHALYPRLLAWLDWQPRAEVTPAAKAPERFTLNAAGFQVDRRTESFFIAGLKKGGPFRFYANGELLANDSGPCIVLEDGRKLVTHLNHSAGVEWSDDGQELIVKGHFAPAKSELMTAKKAVLLRGFMLIVGRFARTLVRKILQKRLILGAEASGFTFERRFRFASDHLEVTDRLHRRGAEQAAVKSIWLGVGQTSIYIAASQPWQASWLLPWVDLSARKAELSGDEGLTVVRRFPVTGSAKP